MNDLLKKILDQTKQADIYDPSFYQPKQSPITPEQENEYLKNPVNIFPLQEPELNYTPLDAGKDQIMSKMSDKQSQRLNLGMMPEERIVSKPSPAKTEQGIPPTDSEKAMDNIEIPEDVVPAKKAPSLEDILAGVKPDNELADAQSANQDFIRNVLLARAGNKIGSSIAGVKSDDNFGQDLIDYSGKKVSDLQTRKKADVDARNQAISEAKSGLDYKRVAFELGDKEKEKDPASDLSTAMRDLIRSDLQSAGVSIPINDAMSYDNLKKLYPSFVNRITNKMTQDRLKADKEVAMAGKESLAAEKKKEKGLLYGDKIAKQLEPIMDRKDKADRISNSIQSAIKNPSGFRDIQAIYDFVKNMDPDSAVREGEVSLAQSTLPIWKKFQLNIEGNIDGDVKSLTPKLRSELAQIASEMVNAVNTTLNSKLDRQRKVADQLGIEEQYWNRLYKPAELKAAEEKASGISTQSSGKVTVTNGKDTFEIDEADLAEAKQDGFEKVK